MQTCPGFFLKSLLESRGNLLEICSVKFVDTLLYCQCISVTGHCFWSPHCSCLMNLRTI